MPPVIGTETVGPAPSAVRLPEPSMASQKVFVPPVTWNTAGVPSYFESQPASVIWMYSSHSVGATLEPGGSRWRREEV